MSTVVYFDIRNFSTHVSYLASPNVGKTSRIFKIIKEVFNSLDKAINVCHTKIGLEGKTYINHTGDGFVAIFQGKGKFLPGLIVASLVAIDTQKILDQYNKRNREYGDLNSIDPLGFGIGIHIGEVKRFNYKQKYPCKLEGVGLLGHPINLAGRVQESTKDHTFQVICTKRVYDEAISVINEKYRKDITENYFTKLDKHKLRGMKSPITLYGIEIGLGRRIKKRMLASL